MNQPRKIRFWRSVFICVKRFSNQERWREQGEYESAGQSILLVSVTHRTERAQSSGSEAKTRRSTWVNESIGWRPYCNHSQGILDNPFFRL